MLLLHRICLNEETLCPYRYSIYDIHRRWAVSVWSLPGVQGFCHVKVWRMQKRICYSPRGSCRVSIDPWMDSLGLPIRERFAFPLSSQNLRLSCTAKLHNEVETKLWLTRLLHYGVPVRLLFSCPSFSEIRGLHCDGLVDTGCLGGASGMYNVLIGHDIFYCTVYRNRAQYSQ